MIVKNENHGISLVEILVIIAFVAVIAAVLLPVIANFHNYRGPSSAAVTCTSNQRKTVACIQLYAQDNEEVLPLSSSIWSNIKVNPPTLICPEDKNSTNSYLYNNRLSGFAIGDVSDPTNIMATVDGKTTIGAKRQYKNVYYTPSDVYRHLDKKKSTYYAIESCADGHVQTVTKVTEPQSWDISLPIKKPAPVKKTVVKKKPGGKK